MNLSSDVRNYVMLECAYTLCKIEKSSMGSDFTDNLFYHLKLNHRMSLVDATRSAAWHSIIIPLSLQRSMNLCFRWCPLQFQEVQNSFPSEQECSISLIGASAFILCGINKTGTMQFSFCVHYPAAVFRVDHFQ